ncbi:hypothetical protein PSET11_03030 [Arthrobacter ulcerisalmonis]|uniref:Uncharacterized protein n=1 Tax=Arthrobacter ulcerisalmonis TaxID=2483813 RepID=A0A3P5XT57_9MICC|nr:hypothetical protein PSET11_03030 [Arthrobacter ulcerisalmonis]
MPLATGAITAHFSDASVFDAAVTGTVTFTPPPAWLLSDDLVTVPVPVVAQVEAKAIALRFGKVPSRGRPPTHGRPHYPASR